MANRLRHEIGDRRILNNISLGLADGELVGLVGPSGCGKSTLLDALNGFRPVEGGTIRVNGKDLYKSFDDFREQIGYMPQDDVVHRALRVESVLRYAARLRLRGAPEAVIDRRVSEALELTSLSHRRRVRVRRLSGGERKRVSLGVELMTHPPLLFLDEPTSGLDPALEAQMMRLFRELTTAGRITVVTTHVMESVELFDQLLVMLQGNIVYAGPPRDALAYFGVESFPAIYEELKAGVPATWRRRFEGSEHYRTWIATRVRSP